MIKNKSKNELLLLKDAINNSWKKIAPFWPLKNLIAVNPLKGFEDLPIEQALTEGSIYFQQDNLPQPMHSVNRETIKWLQLFFDNGQAVIFMPMRQHGLYASWKFAARFDEKLYGQSIEKKEWIAKLPQSSEQVIFEILLLLNVAVVDSEEFITLMLTTLPGWAGHIKHNVEWSNSENQHPVSYNDYLAIRLVITYLLCPDATILLKWYKKARLKVLQENILMPKILAFEKKNRPVLLEKIVKEIETVKEKTAPGAQFIFCIDVRSEQFRRALESTGNYETYGFAGFFGLPIKVKDCITGKSYSSCPVLIKPLHNVSQSFDQINEKELENYNFLQKTKCLYQSLKYNFTTSFALVETLGLPSGIWMGLRTFAPKLASHIKKTPFFLNRPSSTSNHFHHDISFDDQCKYGESALRTMGLTKNFAPIIVFCGHGSSTQNNAYATILDCGACGGNCGSVNASVLADILNEKNVRNSLFKTGIIIPELTHFVGAMHNTTTDKVTLNSSKDLKNLDKIKSDLEIARTKNSQRRCKEMGLSQNINSVKEVELRSLDWAQVRPEWGLAGNATFIVGPRYLTKNIDLEGRAFLHSYEYKDDGTQEILRSILMAPMVVAQWINMQYLFSTLDNVAYGSGSKVTMNITGKIGIMQGNASDLMNGLPLQSVYETDLKPYHQPERLMTVVYAPAKLIDSVIESEDVLKKLFGHGWVTLVCIEPETQEFYLLERDLRWKKLY